MTYQPDHFAFFYFKVDIMQYRIVLFISERYIFEAYGAANVVMHGALMILNFRLGIDDFKNTFRCCKCLCKPAGEEADKLQRTVQHTGIRAKLNEFTQLHLFAQDKMTTKIQHDKVPNAHNVTQ